MVVTGAAFRGIADGIQGRESIFIAEGIGAARGLAGFLLRFGQIDMDRFAVIPAHPAPHLAFLAIFSFFPGCGGSSR
ncbi:hypothetical protein OJ587_11635, partial [Streptococcus anginosus]|nr:hypothetical protein [Streptococcus anginosus]